MYQTWVLNHVSDAISARASLQLSGGFALLTADLVAGAAIVVGALHNASYPVGLPAAPRRPRLKSLLLAT